MSFFPTFMLLHTMHQNQVRQEEERRRRRRREEQRRLAEERRRREADGKEG